MSTVLSTVDKAAAMNALAALLNGGSLKLYTGTSPGPDAAATGTLLATLTLPATFAATTATATVTANAIGSATAVAAGTPGYGRLLKSDGTTVLLDTPVVGSGDGLVVTGSITTGGTVSVSSLSITQT